MCGISARYVRDDGRHVIVESHPREVPPAESVGPELSALSAYPSVGILGSFEDEDVSVVVPPVFEDHGAPPRVGDVG